MRLTSLARRSVATLAATTLLTAGGAASGLLVGTALAQDITVTLAGGGSPIAINNATVSFDLHGTSFFPSGQDGVELIPHTPVIGQGNITGAVAPNAVACGDTPPVPPVPDNDCGTLLTFSAPLDGVAPGFYDVHLTMTPKTDLPNNTPQESTCASCVTVLSQGPATVTDVNGPGNGQLTITGTNFARGAHVDFFKTDSSGSPTTPDPAITFLVTTWASKSLSGTYTAGSSFTSGLHILRVTNLDDSVRPGPGAQFVQPRVTNMVPAVLGQGANTIPVTVTGGGFGPDTTASYSDGTVQVSGSPVPAAGGGSMVLPTTVGSGTPAGVKTLRVLGKGGAFTTFDGLTVTPRPLVTAVNGSPRGQGSSGVLSITGSGFNSGTAFNFGEGVTAINQSGTTATLAQVLVTVDPDTLVATRPVTATNGDFGTSTLPAGFSVVAKPLISSVAPPSGGLGKTVPVTIQGTNFSTGGMTLAVSGTGITVGTITVDNSQQLRTTLTIASDAIAGSRNLTLTSTANGGKSTCQGCFGVNALTVSPVGAANTGTKTITVNGSGLTPNTVVTLSLPGNPDYQQPITVTNVVQDPNNGAISADFNLLNVATGVYSVTTRTPTTPTTETVLSCVSCFPVYATASPLVQTSAPNTAGQGAVDRDVLITGNNFSPGETVAFSGTGVTTSHVTYISPTQIRATYSVAPAAAPGVRSLTVTNIGDGRAGTGGTTPATGGVTINAGPTVAKSDTDSLGQNAVQDVVLTGTNFVTAADCTVVPTPCSVASFGPGVTVVTKSITATAMTLTLTVADNAATTDRDISVVNPDGGQTALAGAFSVTLAPRIVSISPNFAKAGETKDVTLTGSGFTSSTSGTGTSAVTTFPTLTMAHVTPTVTSVSADGTSMVASFVVDNPAPRGTPALTVTNPDGGKSTKPAAFTIATVPDAPTGVAVPTKGDHTATVTWDPAAAGSDGGSAITSYLVSRNGAPVTDNTSSTTDTSQSLPADATSATFTGLTNGFVYTFTVKALNVIGSSAGSVAQGTPLGKPLAPTSVNAQAGDGKVLVGFSGADGQGAPITGYTVKSSDGQFVSVPGSSSSALVSGLANGTAYTFTVKATNASGDSAYSTASAVATPKYSTKITSYHAPSVGTAGSAVALSGRLTRVSDGANVPSAGLVVTLTPELGAARNINLVTDVNGVWRTSFTPLYNTQINVSFPGSSSMFPSSAAPALMGVHPKVVRTSPASGATSAASSVIYVKGSISPNKAGRTVSIYNSYGKIMASSKVASNGTFAIPSKLARGTYTLHLGITATPGNISGISSNFTLKRV